MKGYDIDTIKKVRQVCDVPLTVLGGAGSYSDIKHIIQLFGTIGVSAGSIFVFKGQYKAVLINYPDHKEKVNDEYIDLINYMKQIFQSLNTGKTHLEEIPAPL